MAQFLSPTRVSSGREGHAQPGKVARSLQQFRFNADTLFPGVGGGQIRAGTPTARIDGQVATAAQLAGQGTSPLSTQEQEALAQFFSPQLSAAQTGRLHELAKLSAAQGLSGGAVFGQLQDMENMFVAEQRAGSFRQVAGLLHREFGRASSAAAQFQSQLGSLSFGGGLSSIGDTAVQKAQFARGGLAALSGVGLGADAIAGVAEARGIKIDRAGTTGRQDIGGAFQQLLSPSLTVEEQQRANALTQPGFARLPGALARRRVDQFILRAEALGSRRAGAAETLSGAIQSHLGGIASGLAEFEGLGAAASLFQQTGDKGLARSIAGADFGGFSGLLKGLGIQHSAARSPLRDSNFLRIFGR